ncbi:MAG: penicillin-binding protein 2 [Victivallaceae bacterium]|nr:penicillin-binding protein 2 [Victivallaceae bacterium]
MTPQPEKSPERSIRIRTAFAVAVIFLIAVALAARFFYIQVMRHEYYLQRAQKKFTHSTRTFGKRGEIFDCRRHLLVGNEPCKEISATPCNITDPQVRLKCARIMARYLGKSEVYFFRKLSPVIRKTAKDGTIQTVPNTYQMIARFFPFEEAMKMEAELRELGVNANTVSFRDTNRRTYPKGRMLASILGFTNIIDDKDVPQGGLEKKLDSEISQTTGKRTYISDRTGVPLENGVIFDQSARDGKNIFLTVDEPIQAILEEELDKAVEELAPEVIYAIIADPMTGRILALAQRPTFNPNDRKTFSNLQAIKNHIAEDCYEPGSVVKPLTIGRALDLGAVTPNQMIDCEKKKWIYGGRPLTDSHAVGNVPLSQVIVQSSNIGTAKIAVMLGKNCVYETMRKFGCLEKSDLPFQIESRGRLVPPHRWDGVQITRVAIGYSVQWSALQLLRAHCGIANPQGMPQLQLIDHYEDPETGESIYPPAGSFRRVFQNESARRQLVEMMIGVTEDAHGTAKRAAIRNYTVAGKTGTSNKYDPVTRHYSNKKMCSFIGFVPARAPRLIMLVTVDSKTKGAAQQGGGVAGPIFSRTAKRVLEYLNVPPDKLLTEKE